MILVATEKHGFRPSGQVFEVDEPLGLILLEQGKAVNESKSVAVKTEKKEVKQKTSKK